MYIPRELFGLETWVIGVGATALYLALGCWLTGRWARFDDPPPRPWKWGDPVRRAKPPLIDRIIYALGPIVTFMATVIFGLKGLGVI
jgi:hypothetical protein